MKKILMVILSLFFLFGVGCADASNDPFRNELSDKQSEDIVESNNSEEDSSKEESSNDSSSSISSEKSEDENSSSEVENSNKDNKGWTGFY